MHYRAEFDCEHVATISFKGDVALGVFVKELADADAVALIFSVREPNNINITLRFNSPEALNTFLQTHERSKHHATRKKPEARGVR
jgi:hypothetical protein